VDIKSISNMDFDTLYDTYSEQVYQTALYYSGNHHIAEEITQAIFTEILDYEEDINLENVNTWFYTLAKNKAQNYVRDHKKELLVASVFEEADNIVHIDGFDNIHEENSVDDYFMEKFSKEKRLLFLEKIYDDLYNKNELWYIAIMGAYILEVPQKIVAKKLGISEGSLKMILKRAKKWIQKRYQEEFDRLENE